MAATADGKTSTLPHWRASPSAVGVFEVMECPWYNSVSGIVRSGPFTSVNPNRKVPHGQALRDLRQRAAIRTPRESREESRQPPVHAEPADGARDGGRPAGSGAHLHALPSLLLGVGEH